MLRSYKRCRHTGICARRRRPGQGGARTAGGGGAEHKGQQRAHAGERGEHTCLLTVHSLKLSPAYCVALCQDHSMRNQDVVPVFATTAATQHCMPLAAAAAVHNFTYAAPLPLYTPDMLLNRVCTTTVRAVRQTHRAQRKPVAHVASVTADQFAPACLWTCSWHTQCSHHCFVPPYHPLVLSFQ